MGIRPNKTLGQNFLVSQNVIDKIIQAAVHCEAKEYIEVGPGPGALTDLLLENQLKPSLIEMDKKIAEYWQSQGLNVIQGDALKQNWSELIQTDDCCFVSNLPYQISSSIVIDRSIGPKQVRNMILMFQKEVAQRIVAPEGGKDYGLLSVIAQSFWEIEKVTEAGPKDFFPPPKVASRVLKFTRKENDVDGIKLLKLTKAAFAQRRKKLLKNLSSFSLDQESLKNELKKWGYAESVRAEQLKVEEFQSIVKNFL